MRTPLSLDRYLTFIDAIVAIAVTLLILPLVEMTSDLTDAESFHDAVLSQEAVVKYGSFVLSFVVIFRFWRVHHRLLEPIESYDNVLVTLTMFWAMTIVFLPYPTALIEIYDGNTQARGLYLVTLVISSGLLTSLSLYLSRKPALFKDEAYVDGYWDLIVPSAATTGLLAVITLVAVLVPKINWGALLLLLLTGVVSRLVNRWRHRNVVVS
ncbi:TMEM175 family protein [Cryptosporangium sp. NPDC051539]|uniref:TMEM175 family protein n=1 Tax=Cryptosporangium sp. NPDC051539 TaxID=3363962 RepID=UPI0037B858DD